MPYGLLAPSPHPGPITYFCSTAAHAYPLPTVCPTPPARRGTGTIGPRPEHPRTENDVSAVTPDLNARHGLNPPHSEVVAACREIQPGKALDMGCGGGRNAVYLGQLGFKVTAVDVNPGGLAMLQSIIDAEGLSKVEARLYDINEAALDADYDFIACTVTLMFLNPARVDAVIADMQQHTKPGGHNLIVVAMDTDAYPCPMNFPFTAKPDQMKNMYAGWELVKYNEDVGTMHNGARLQFATMLARKPS